MLTFSKTHVVIIIVIIAKAEEYLKRRFGPRLKKALISSVILKALSFCKTNNLNKHVRED